MESLSNTHQKSKGNMTSQRAMISYRFHCHQNVKKVKQINQTPKPSLHKDPKLNEKTVTLPEEP
ncbi:hypothetical protein YC2023_069011 [Brassica napus]